MIGGEIFSLHYEAIHYAPNLINIRARSVSSKGMINPFKLFLGNISKLEQSYRKRAFVGMAVPVL